MTNSAVTLVPPVGIAAISSLVPYLTRPDLFFSWTVPPGFRSTDAGRRVIIKYLAAGWLGTLAVLALASLWRSMLSQSASDVMGGVILVWALAFFAGRKL